MRSVEAVLATGAELALVISQKRPEVRKNPPWKRLVTLLKAPNALWTAYERLYIDRYVSGLRGVDAAGLFAGVPVIECETVRKGKFSEYFRPEDIERIRAARLDFLLRFAFGIIRGNILQSARYGVWSFHHDDEQRYRGGPPAFWEMYFNDPHTGVVLQRLTERLDGGIILKKGSFPTINDSYARNYDQSLFGAAGWAGSVCRDIAAGQAAYLEDAPSRSSAPVFRAPSNSQMVVFGARLLRNAMANRVWARRRAPA